jgi:hypothetical protein
VDAVSALARRETRRPTIGERRGERRVAVARGARPEHAPPARCSGSPARSLGSSQTGAMASMSSVDVAPHPTTERGSGVGTLGRDPRR